MGFVDGDDDAFGAGEDWLSTEMVDESAETPIEVEEEDLRPKPWEKYAAIRNRLLVIISVVQAFAVVTSMAYLPVLPTVQETFGADDFTANLTMVSFTLATGFMPLFHGPLCDRYGRKTMLLAGILGYTGSMLMAGSATSIWGLVVYRFLVGLFSSGFTTYCGGILGDILNPEERATFISLTMMPSMILAMVAPFIAGILTDLLGWRFGAFYLLVILMALFIPVVVWFVPETLARLQILKREPGEETPEERAAAEAPVKKINPIFPLQLVLSWPMLGTVIANAMLFSTSYLQNSQFSLIVGKYFDFSATVIGLLLIPVGIGRVVGTIFGGKVSDMAREAAHKRGWNRRTGNLIVAFAIMVMSVVATALFGTVVFSAVVGAIFASLGGLGAMVCRSITFAYAVEMHGKNAGGATAGLVCVQFLIVTASLLLVSWFFSFVGVILTFILAAVVLAVTMIPFAYVIVSQRHVE